VAPVFFGKTNKNIDSLAERKRENLLKESHFFIPFCKDLCYNTVWRMLFSVLVRPITVDRRRRMVVCSAEL
jgi:hypothetical protein